MKSLTIRLSVAGALALCTQSYAFDHSTFDRVLTKYVTNGRVNYKGLKADKDFPKYLAALASADTKSLGGGNDKLAFWINAYNASCLDGVLKRYPLSSVMKVKGFFTVKEHKVAGKTRSLDDIEHGILRKLGEPRIHFAVNCASASCPALSNHAYKGSTLSSQLDAAAKAFVNDGSKNKFNPSAKSAQLSSLFKWYGKDFGSQSQLLKVLGKYASSAATAAMLKSGSAKVSYLPYDWSLNGS